MHARYVIARRSRVNSRTAPLGFRWTQWRTAATHESSMAIFLRASLILCVFLAGCAGVPQRRAIRETLAPEPMSARAWAAVVGTYTGPVRSTMRRFRNEGASVAETRVEISGDAQNPRVFLKMQTGYTSAWVSYVERDETFTNIPERRYGTQGFVLASTHEPDQLMLRFRPGVLSANARAFWIITFCGRDCATIEAVGRSGRYGEGTLHRVPAFSGACR